jgi:tripartite-type tricarboxylate transporter receptor subunit TctC
MTIEFRKISEDFGASSGLVERSGISSVRRIINAFSAPIERTFMTLRSVQHCSGIAAIVFSACCLLTPGGSRAQSFPERPIKIVVPGVAGSIADIYARRYAQPLGVLLGQPVVVDNKPGASGAIAMDAVSRAPADGYTLTVASLMESGLARSLGFPYPDVEKLLTPVAFLTEGGNFLLVNSSLGVKTMTEFVAYVKRQTKPLDVGIGGLYGGHHINTEQLSKLTGHKFQLVPYKSTSAQLPDLANGIIPVAFATATEARPYVESGKVIALASNAQRRSPLLPEVSTMSEQGFAALEFPAFMVIQAPSEVPESVLRKLHEVFAKVSALPDLQEKLRLGGGFFRDLTLDELRLYVKDLMTKSIAKGRETGIRYEP